MTCLKITFDITLQSLDGITISLYHWEQILELTSLKELSIKRANIYLLHWDLVWNTLSPRLTSLKLEMITFSERDMNRAAATNVRVREFDAGWYILVLVTDIATIVHDTDSSA